MRRIYSGKVRELYETGDGRLLIVASDRISAFDYVLETPIPDKGKILTQLSLWWFERLAEVIDNHVVSDAVPNEFAGRGILVDKLDMVDVECVARGYLTGSGLSDYQVTGTVCGIELPPGLRDGDKLPEPIFTPATKAPRGEHDRNVSYAEIVDDFGESLAVRLREATLAAYRLGARIAGERGIIVADTKFEFGFDAGGRLLLADEVFTPDSSRFWPRDAWQPGRTQPSFDKQYVRNWLTSSASGWERDSGQPPPPLPDSVVDRTRSRYIEAYERITGNKWI